MPTRKWWRTTGSPRGGTAFRRAAGRLATTRQSDRCAHGRDAIHEERTDDVLKAGAKQFISKASCPGICCPRRRTVRRASAKRRKQPAHACNHEFLRVQLRRSGEGCHKTYARWSRKCMARLGRSGLRGTNATPSAAPTPHAVAATCSGGPGRARDTRINCTFFDERT
jgi:hypothetical protein